MAQSAAAALWFLPFVLPICLYIAWTDLKAMRIPNVAVLTLVVIYIVIGPFALPLELYGYGFLHLIVVLLIGILLNAAGLIGAGDAKFAAAAAPFIAFGDLRLILMIYTAALLAGWTTHRLARVTPLHRLAPDWQSWQEKRNFPMGLVLGPTLALYLSLALVLGA